MVLSIVSTKLESELGRTFRGVSLALQTDYRSMYSLQGSEDKVIELTMPEL